MARLAPTSPQLLDPDHRPYFLWWLDCTVAELRGHLGGDDVEKRAYYLGALLREANTRDVWLFTTPDQVRALWPQVSRLPRTEPIALGVAPRCLSNGVGGRMRDHFDLRVLPAGAPKP